MKQEAEDVATPGATGSITSADITPGYCPSGTAIEQLAGTHASEECTALSLILSGVDTSLIVNGDSNAEAVKHSQTGVVSSCPLVAPETSLSISSETAGSDRSTKLATSLYTGSTHTLSSSTGGGISIVDFLESS